MAGLGTSIRIANAYVQLDVRGQRRMEALLGRAAAAVGKSAKEMRRLGLSALAFGSAAVFAFAKTVQGASDLTEQTNKAVEVFGGSAVTILDWSKTTARSFGIAKREALAYSSELGLIIQQSGKTRKESVELSKSMVELAADLASFNNVEISVAFDKLKSGLVGESKPLREFGILLNESEVASKAMALGFKKVNGELTEAAKVSARYELILEQSVAAQGDFGRTINDLANATRVLKARLKDVSDEIGKALIPAFTYLIDRATRLTEVFEESVLMNQRVIRTLFGLSAALVVVGGALTAAGTAAGLFAYSLTNLGKIVAGARFSFGVLTGAITGTTVAVVALQTAFVGLAFFVGYQIGAALADLFFNATESAKKLNEEILRSGILAKGLDELRLKNLRRIVLETGNLEQNEKKLRGEYIKSGRELERSRLSLEEFWENPIAAQRGQRERGEKVRGNPELVREIAEMERAQAVRKQVLDEAQAKLDAGQAAEDEKGAKAAKAKSTRYEDQLKLLERQRIELEKGAIAAQAYDDAQEKLTPAQMSDLKTKRQALDADTKAKKAKEDQLAAAESIKTAGKEELKTLAIQLRYQKQGALEVEKQLNIMRGMSPILAEQIRAKKEKIELDQEAIDLAEEQKQKNQALLDNFKDQKRELQLQLLALQKGEEAAARARDKDAGFSLQQRKELARLRKEIKKEEAEEERQREREKELKKKDKNSKDSLDSIGGFFGGGFAQRLAVGGNMEEDARKQRIEQTKKLRQIAHAYRKFNSNFGAFEKNQETWFQFQKQTFGRIISR